MESAVSSNENRWGSMVKNLSAYSASYQRWSRAQEEVSEYEKLIFDALHQLKDSELSHLRELRATAALCLRQLIEELDTGIGRARDRDGPRTADRPAQ